MNILNKYQFSWFIAVLLLVVSLPFDYAMCQTIHAEELGLTEYSLGVSLGVNDFHMKDKYLSSLPYRGTFFTGAISFETQLLNTKHEVELFFGHGNPSPDNQAFDIIQNIGSLSYSFLYFVDRTYIAESQINIFLGEVFLHL